MMTHDQAERLIERLADKTIDFGCEVISSKWSYQSRELITHTYHSPEPRNYQFECSGRKEYLQRYEIESVIGHPIMLTDVLEKVEKKNLVNAEMFFTTNVLVDKWKQCGFTNSLQTILAEATFTLCNKHKGKQCGCPEETKSMTFSCYEDLFSYLSSLFPET